MSIKNIFANGVLVDVNIRAWTGEKMLTAEDMGIDPDSIPESFKLGRKSLIPPRIIAKIKNMDYLARKALNAKSFEFPFGNARFLPKKTFEEFNNEYEVLKASYDALVNDLITNFDTYKREMRTDFITAAKEAYQRLTKLHGIEDQILCLPRIVKGPDGKDTTVMQEITLDNYINEFLERIEKSYPKVEAIKGRFSMEFVAFQMELPDLIEATIDDVAEENQKINLLQNAFQMKMRKEMESYAEKIVKENRDRVSEIVTAMTEKLSNGKRFTETTYQMILNAINNFKSMNIVNDERLEKALDDFKNKYLVTNDSKTIRENMTIQKNMLSDFILIGTIINDAAEIQALADGYKAKINL